MTTKTARKIISDMRDELASRIKQHRAYRDDCIFRSPENEEDARKYCRTQCRGAQRRIDALEFLMDAPF